MEIKNNVFQWPLSGFQEVKYVMTKDKKLKNGSSVKIQKNYTSVKIDVQNPKGRSISLLIILNRKQM